MNETSTIRLRFPPMLALAMLAGVCLDTATAQSFDAGDKTNVVVIAPPPPPAPAAPHSISLKEGEILEVYQHLKTTGEPELVFYLPRAATSVVQLVTEKKNRRQIYFVRGLAPGRTIGGVVQREWLDTEGFKARTPADEARIQSALKAGPWLITVLPKPAPVQPALPAASVGSNNINSATQPK